MAFDKTKVVRAAEKYLAQGKIPAAIKEYRAIVEHDSTDFTALNMLGDLYARAGNKADATTAFTRIAEHYREKGFALKAIAMYKKIDRLQPGSIEIAGKLATLYEVQGLNVDARAQYLIVADALSKANQPQKALEILRKIADLDHQNVDIRLRLAEGYMRENLRTDAARAYAAAGAQLLERKQYERALDALTKALDVDALDKESLSNLIDAHVALGTADEAAEVLEAAVAQQPHDAGLLSMLTDTYIEAEDAVAAERTAAMLIAQDSSAYPRFADVARLYLRQGDVADAARLVSGISEQMLDGREEEKLIKLLNEMLARDPEQLDALRLMVRVHTWQHNDEKLRLALEHLAEAAETTGHAEDERFALSQLVRLAPEKTHYTERLQALGDTMPDGASASPANDPFYGATQLDDEVPTFESFMLANDEPPVANASELPGSTDPASEFEWNTIASPAATQTSVPADPSTSFADLNDGWTSPDESSAQASTGTQSPASGFQEFDFNSVIAESPAARAPVATHGSAPGTASPATIDSRREAMLRQELESVDFYLAQGYTDIALDTLEMLEQQFGAHAEIDSRRAQLQTAAPPSSTAAHDDSAQTQTVEFSGFSLYDPAQETAETTPPAPPAPADDVDAAFVSLEGASQNTVSSSPAMADVFAQSSVIPPTAATATPQQSIDPGLAAIFDEFRTASEEDDPAVSNGDYETHYNLGLAYKEMDLMDDAVEEFQTAAGLAAPRDGTPRYLQCCNLLGHCFMQKGMPRLAVMWFKKGLDAPGHSEDEYQALKFELGTAFEQMGDLDKAIDTFTEVYGVNVSYRGVADKLRDLQAQRAMK